MKILVGIKRVVDYNVRVRVKPDGSGVALDGVKMSINPFDEIALEEALRIRERGQATEVLAVAIGPDDVQTQLRSALAMGADRAILVKHDGAIEPRDVARALLEVIKKEQVGLAILGKQAIDDDAGKVELRDGVAVVTREVDTGLETLEIDLPAVITSDLRLNEPRYIKLPDIMKAKKKPLDVTDLATLGVNVSPQFKVQKTEAPPQRARGIMVKDVPELLAEMRKRGVVS
jgi:electron transfer flavoprotein beta subunit